MSTSHKLPLRYRLVLGRYAEEVTQQAIAEDLNVCRATLNRWLQGHHGCTRYDEVVEYVERLLIRRPDLAEESMSDTVKQLEEWGMPLEKARMVAPLLTP